MHRPPRRRRACAAALSSSRGTRPGDVGDHQDVEEHGADDDQRDLRASRRCRATAGTAASARWPGCSAGSRSAARRTPRPTRKLPMATPSTTPMATLMRVAVQRCARRWRRGRARACRSTTGPRSAARWRPASGPGRRARPRRRLGGDHPHGDQADEPERRRGRAATAAAAVPRMRPQRADGGGPGVPGRGRPSVARPVAAGAGPRPAPQPGASADRRGVGRAGHPPFALDVGPAVNVGVEQARRGRPPPR